MKTKLALTFAFVVALVVTSAALAARLDVIRGTHGPDKISGTPHDDVIYARAGDDEVRAHDGHDVVFGSYGDDVLRGGHDADILYGQEGNDVTWAGSGADVTYGGPGNDVLHALANDNQRDVLDCGSGHDTAFVITNDPATIRGCEVVVRLSPDEAAAMASANDDD
jgi:Ca2+-binding RTX toxin-like protein